MRNRSVLLGVLVAVAMSVVARGQSTQPMVLAHYMAWFAAPPVSPQFGWHWTMNHFDPRQVDAGGRRAIAAKEYPAIGPYDSGDPDLITYHLLLMHLAGIDGVVVDWYGDESREDYPAINANAQVLLAEAQRRGMRFAIAFEDRIYEKLDVKAAVDRAHAAMQYAGQHFFNSPAYVKQDGRPIVLIFGPAAISDAKAWDAVFAGLPQRPRTYVLHDGGPADAGRFAWPPMHLAKDGVLSIDALRQHFSQFTTGDAIPAAVKGFNDSYRDAGVGPGYGVLDDRQGETFRETLSAALKSNQPIVQLVTWNDFGEGTTIEPTREQGLRYLQIVHQERFCTPLDSGAAGAAEAIYAIRKSPQGEAKRADLDRATDLLFAGKTAEAQAVLAGLVLSPK